MKKLVVIPCFGDISFIFCAELAVLSLRQMGRFDGEILAITDLPPLHVPQSIGDHAQVHHVPRQTGNCFRTKIAMARHVPHADFDSILWIDCDILAVADVAQMFATGDQLLCSEEPYWPMTDPRFSRCSSLQTRNSLMVHRRGINSGCFSVRADRFTRVMGQWQRRFDECGCDQDQQSFNDLIVTGQLPAKAYPPNWVDFPRVNARYGRPPHLTGDQTPRMLHYCGDPGKLQALALMEIDFVRYGGKGLV